MPESSDTTTTTEEETYESWTVNELKDELSVRETFRRRATRTRLIARLEENDVAERPPETVAELKEELAERDLPTSGRKDEVIERLEEAEPGSTSTELEAQVQAEEDTNPDPNKRIYSPYELPVNTTAAQQFINAHPGDVDLDAVLEPPERQEMAVANIQDHVDTLSEAGYVVEDPRLGEGSGRRSGGEEISRTSRSAPPWARLTRRRPSP